ncbi:TPA: hypothetical protein NWA42_002921 [Escherichia coli]|nr:hypothetical protein [Escherichia coli]HCJ9799686.1 hypothetical protein [Escherichia coli]
MTFPSEVIYTLANIFRRGHNFPIFRKSADVTADFLFNYLIGTDPASVTQETIMDIERVSEIIPIDYASGYQDGVKFNFSMGMRRTSIDIKPRTSNETLPAANYNHEAHGNWLVVVEQGKNQYEVVAAKEENYFDLGQISRTEEIFFNARQGNIGVTGSTVCFILSSWPHVGYVLTNASKTFHTLKIEHSHKVLGDLFAADAELPVSGTEVAVCENYDDLKSVLVKRDVFESLNLDFPGDEKEISVADLVEALCQKDQANEISDEEAELFQVQQLVSKVIGGQEIVDTLMALPAKKRTQKYIRELVLKNLGQAKK